MTLLRRSAYYAFAPFLVLVAYAHDQLGVDPLVDTESLAYLIASVLLYTLTPKTFFRAVYFNFLLIWFCLGTVNFIVHRLIWFGFDADILAYHHLCALFLFAYTAWAFVLGRSVKPGPIMPIVEPAFDLGFATRVALAMCVLMLMLILPAVGWTGVFGGALTDANRFSVAVNPIVPRLSLAFPYLACVLMVRFSRRDVSLVSLLGFTGLAFFTLSIMGARFGFFQVMVTALMFLVFAGQQQLLRAYRLHVAFAAAFLVVFQLLLPTLRAATEKPDSIESVSSAMSFMSGWGDEHRDAAASMVLISDADRREISDNYLESVLLPALPDPLVSALGMDKAGALKGGAAYYMQRAYDMEDGTIRIGGIAEAYFWLGSTGVLIVAFLIAFAATRIEIVIYSRAPKTFTRVALAAYGSVWLFYFPASQANMLLGSYVAFVVLHFGIAWTARWSGHVEVARA